MNLLLIGDVFGRTGLKALSNELKKIKNKYQIDFTICNGENVSFCRGLNMHDYLTLNKIGVDFITMGNHAWKQPDFLKVLNHKNIIAPYNIHLNDGNNSIGYRIIEYKNKKIRIINLLGESVFFKYGTIFNPFKTLEKILANDQDVDINIVDFHAEATSEKNCMLKAFSGKVQIIFGTHTHVQTNDARIYNNTAYITDLGMTGPSDGIIGAKDETLIKKFFGETKQFKLEESGGKYQFCAVVIKIDDQTNLPKSIENIFIYEE